MTDIIQRLRQYEGKSWETTVCHNGLRDEAASEIERLRKIEAAAQRMVSAQHAGPITMEMLEAWDEARTLLESGVSPQRDSEE